MGLAVIGNRRRRWRKPGPSNCSERAWQRSAARWPRGLPSVGAERQWLDGLLRNPGHQPGCQPARCAESVSLFCAHMHAADGAGLAWPDVALLRHFFGCFVRFPLRCLLVLPVLRHRPLLSVCPFSVLPHLFCLSPLPRSTAQRTTRHGRWIVALGAGAGAGGGGAALCCVVGTRISVAAPRTRDIHHIALLGGADRSPCPQVPQFGAEVAPAPL
eukprot:COSAG02_NODE_1822_length_10761_cov_48.708685_8_plen_215_part_00